MSHAAAWCAADEQQTRNWTLPYGDIGQAGRWTAALLDYHAKQLPFPFITTVAGNEGAATEVNNGLMRNGLIVGFVDDMGTSSRADDVMNPSSNTTNPASTHGDLEVPHIVAPGTNVYSNALCASGSSLAAPMVAGVGALLEQRNPDIAHWPEAKRAFTLVSADENIHNMANPLKSTIDHQDGAGELNASLALTVANPENRRTMDETPSRYGYDFATMTAFSGWYGGRQPLISTGYRVQIPAGPTGMDLRVVLAWDATACPGTPFQYGSCEATVPDADLDLYVCEVGGNGCSNSTSFDNTWEMVQTYANPGSTYDIYINAYSFTASYTYFAVAWAADTYGKNP